jgi:AcrR family transcriptional regulator
MAKRADNVGETRQRIIEAAVELHGTVGPAGTTVAGIAERAGVTRLTVYRHFPDDESLFHACSAHWESWQTLPDPRAWAQVADPIERVRHALTDLYRFYRAGAAMLTLIHRDIALVPEGRRQVTRERAEAMRAVLVGAFARSPRLEAAVGHAMSFQTWKSLCTEQALSNHDAVELMVALVELTSRRR